MEQPQNAVVRKRICRVLAVCWMVVIFAFSARNADLSTQDSMSIGILFGRLVVPSFAEMDAQMQVSFDRELCGQEQKASAAGRRSNGPGVFVCCFG